MPFEDLPQLVLYQKEHPSIAALIRELLSFSALPFTEISVTSPNASLPEILPAFAIDGEVTCGTHAVCRRISAVVGLHGSTPKEDALVDAIASQMLDLWEAILTQKREKLKTPKINGILIELNNFVKDSKNDRYLVGKKVRNEDQILAYMGRFNVDSFCKVLEERIWRQPAGTRSREVYQYSKAGKKLL